MKTKNIDGLEVSELALTCTGTSKEKGNVLIAEAIKLGITTFNIDPIVCAPESKCITMSVISALESDKLEINVKAILDKIGKPDIVWVTDLGNGDSYRKGEYIYKALKDRFPRVGVSSASGDLILRFKNNYPECKFFMVPVHRGDMFIKNKYSGNEKMFGFIEEAKKQGKFVFGKNPFCKGLHIGTHSTEDCLKTAKGSGADCVLINTQNIVALEEMIKIYKEI